MPEVTMPRLSDSMQEGTIVRWLKSEGDVVARGDEIVEIETDKATMPYEAGAAGPLTILVGEGETVPVGTAIAVIGELERVGAAGGAASAIPVASVTTAPDEARGGHGRRMGISPVASRTARRLGVSIEALIGTGPRGRILKRDVVAAAHNGDGAATSDRPVPALRVSDPNGAVVSAGTAKGRTMKVALSRLQATVARRMQESKTTVPDFWTAIDVDMRGVVALRDDLKHAADPTPSVNDVLVKAVALALRRHPRLNGAYREGVFELYERVNVGVAVAASDGLVVPTVFDADRRSLGEIAADTRVLAAKVRDGAITPPEIAGGTFTVSNLGMFGVSRFAGIINPPQAAILCVGAIEDRVRPLEGGQIGVVPMVTLTLVTDHRIVYGAEAAAFLGELRSLLERPLAILL